MAPVCVVIELNLPPTLCVRQKRKGWGTRQLQYKAAEDCGDGCEGLPADGAEPGGSGGGFAHGRGGLPRGRPDFCDAGSGEAGLRKLDADGGAAGGVRGDMPEVFVPIARGWGRMGMTHIRLAAAGEDVLAGALRTRGDRKLRQTT